MQPGQSPYETHSRANICNGSWDPGTILDRSAIKTYPRELDSTTVLALFQFVYSFLYKTPMKPVAAPPGLIFQVIYLGFS